MPDLTFYQAEDEQGQADHGDQGGDAPVVLQEEGGDGEGAFERRVAASDRVLSFAGEEYPGGVGLAGIQVGTLQAVVELGRSLAGSARPKEGLVNKLPP